VENNRLSIEKAKKSLKSRDTLKEIGDMYRFVLKSATCPPEFLVHASDFNAYSIKFR